MHLKLSACIVSLLLRTLRSGRGRGRGRGLARAGPPVPLRRAARPSGTASDVLFVAPVSVAGISGSSRFKKFYLNNYSYFEKSFVWLLLSLQAAAAVVDFVERFSVSGVS